jgi:hypothetical protein
MRLAVISDVHGNLPALEAVVADIKKRQVDTTVNLGDCVTSPLWPKETLKLSNRSDCRLYVETTIGGSKNFPRINFRPQDDLLGTR